MNDRNNANFKHLAHGLELSVEEIVAICHRGGLAVATSRVRRWRRSATAAPADYAGMRDDEFDAFCRGLAQWLRDETNA